MGKGNQKASRLVDYYQRTRTHLSLDKDCLDPRSRFGAGPSHDERRCANAIWRVGQTASLHVFYFLRRSREESSELTNVGALKIA